VTDAPPSPSPHRPVLATDELRRIADDAGIHRVQLLAWRELGDPEAGGSEVHAHEVMRRWAAAGMAVTIRTSAVEGQPSVTYRDRYRAIRAGGRYTVFPRAALAAATHRMGPRDGLVEIWNGVPFLSPIWDRGPHIVVVHHVHGPMWQMALGRHLGRVGEVMERRLAPRFYRNTRIVTLSTSSRDELVDELGFDPDKVEIVPPGIDTRFRPGAERSPTPLVAAIGRLVPVKRFDALIRSVAPLRDRHPGLEVVIAGEGYERPALEAEISRLGVGDWVRLPGRVSDQELVRLLQHAWIVTSSSAVEGWGMTITEAAACGTPAVASRTTGHLDAVADGVTGLLADSDEALTGSLDRVLADHALRARMAEAALERSARFTWDATAESIMRALAADATDRHRLPGR
jgi:glycosyltransferase involved in cell wall biosynthesis